MISDNNGAQGEYALVTWISRYNKVVAGKTSIYGRSGYKKLLYIYMSRAVIC
jgi:hypothetical protein